MGKNFDALEAAHVDFVRAQRIFFTASAAGDAHVNISPRSTDAFRVVDARTVVYRDLTGSGSETAAHVRAGGRMTIMFCAFDGPPQILRLYGRGRIVHVESPDFAPRHAEHFSDDVPLGTRALVFVDLDLVRTSCGYGVPSFAYAGERPTLARWAATKGGDALRTYRRTRNVASIDGLPTGFSDQANASSSSARRPSRRSP